MSLMKRFAGQSAFAVFLRTGVRFQHPSGSNVEVKFNPWHDPDDGRFTFKGQGTNFAGEGGDSSRRQRSSTGRGSEDRVRSGGVSTKPSSAEARAQADDVAIRRRNEIYDPDNPANYSDHAVKPGDTLTAIAATRRGLTAERLARLNATSANATLHVGQAIKVPNQAHLDALKDAQGVVSGLSHYMKTHGGQVPSGAGKLTDQLAADRIPIKKNGYTFQLDGLFRSRNIGGVLADEAGKRSRRNQGQASGTDRRAGDDGGHYIAVRFNGPSDSFNHFAQDANFNRGAYRVLEDEMAREQRAGKQVYVKVVPYYQGISQRPYRIDVAYNSGGSWKTKRFVNAKGGK